ncbi:MAG TPA: Ltp family lipoprotein [Solirubrobacteraceae bacterium]|nr:Ltp family lipoprotein [Solirubrobacteraceae bacterium]
MDRWKEIPMAARIIVGAVVVIVILAIAGSGGKKSSSTTTLTQAVAATPPPVALKLATGDYSVTASHTTLHGTVSAGAEVQVGEDGVVVHGTHWSKTVPLEIGSNAEEVTANLAGHETTTKTITVVRHHTQAELEAKAQARREREQREREAQERRERKEREQNEIEEASLAQQNALHSAEKYLEYTAFSQAGLIEQLSSEAGEKYPEQDAVWAVEHLSGVNWDDQAAKSAKKYLEYTSFSCQGLIEQLSSEAGEKFTLAQAEYGARQVGLC